MTGAPPWTERCLYSASSPDEPADLEKDKLDALARRAAGRWLQLYYSRSPTTGGQHLFSGQPRVTVTGNSLQPANEDARVSPREGSLPLFRLAHSAVSELILGSRTSVAPTRPRPGRPSACLLALRSRPVTCLALRAAFRLMRQAQACIFVISVL